MLIRPVPTHSGSRFKSVHVLTNCLWGFALFLRYQTVTFYHTVTFRSTVTFHACSDAGAAENVSCSAHQFRCGSGKCIERDAVCDYQRDCQYGEDEAPHNALCGTVNVSLRQQRHPAIKYLALVVTTYRAVYVCHKAVEVPSNRRFACGDLILSDCQFNATSLCTSITCYIIV